MDSFVLIVIVIGAFSLPFIGSRWSYIGSLISAGCLTMYGLAMVIFGIIEAHSNSSLTVVLGAVFCAIGALIAGTAIIVRRRVLRKMARPWN